MNFPLRFAFAASHGFCAVVCSFTFISRIFFISYLISLLMYSLFNEMLFSLHEFECFWDFSLRSVSNFKPLWSKKMVDMISTFLRFFFLRLVLWLTMWSIFQNVPCAFEKNVYFAFLGWKVLYISQLSPLDLECRSMPQYSSWFFAWKISPLLTMEY